MRSSSVTRGPADGSPFPGSPVGGSPAVSSLADSSPRTARAAPIVATARIVPSPASTVTACRWSTRSSRPPTPCEASRSSEARAVMVKCSWRRPTNVRPLPSRAVSLRTPPSSVPSTSAGNPPAATQDSGRSPPVSSSCASGPRPSGGSIGSPARGQPSSSQRISQAKVSRPSTCQCGVPPRARTPRNTMAQLPSGRRTRSACPVFWTGVPRPRAVSTGLCGQGSKGPAGDGPRATVTACPRSVPPSATTRYQWSPIR